ncbi:MAG: hypothetical protein KAG99_10575 [Bacteroidales bacterium]|nr:hypothetical protein [Bacteroidales bacterium]
MKDQEFKDIWRSLEEYPGVPIGGVFDAENFIKSRSITIKDKIRKILHNDMLFKLGSGIVFLLDIAFYINTINVLYVCFAGLIFLAIMSFIEYKNLQQFNRIADPGLSTRDNLSEILIFLQRKSNILGILTASSQILIFVPGLLAYFFLTYRQLKPMTGMSFFVFSTLCLIGTITSYSRTISQIKYYIKHITICMSDLNDDILQMAYSSIEKERKRDETMKVVIGLLLIFAFVAFIAVLKSIMG